MFILVFRYVKIEISYQTKTKNAMEQIFVELGIAIVSATALGVVARILRQPLILAYIFTGFILGPSLFGLITGEEVISLFSTIGIAFLLFIVGMELSLHRIKEVGGKAIVIGLIQLLATGILGYFLCLLLGFTNIVSIYIGILLAFSSTVIVIKLLSEKKALSSLYGKIVIGILILQDIAALFILIVLSGMGGGTDLSPLLILEILLDGIVAVLLVYFVSKIFLYRLFRYVARSAELLFLTSIAWCFLVSAFFVFLGFSIEMGAFLAGITIAGLPYREDITNKLSHLRDFFLILFFVALGMQIDFTTLGFMLFPLIALVFFVIFVKSLIILITMGALSFTKRTSFYSALSLSQVSEFSLIIAGMGLSLGYLSEDVVSLVIVVTIITIISSSYIITFLGNIYNLLQKPLRFFEKKNISEQEKKAPKLNGHIILFGYNRLGPRIFGALKKISKKIIVVDLNPEVVEGLMSHDITCVYGDAYDVELLEQLNINKAKMVVITFPAKKSNRFLIKKVREENKRAKIITIAEDVDEALYLYGVGADYVILPHYISAEHISSMLDKVRKKKQKLREIKKYHIESLEKIK